MKKESKLWNRNFFLLWQGQLVSAFGDALYTIALSFFVLELTGSYSCHGNDYGSCHSSKGSIGTAFGHNGRPSRQKETDCHRGFNPGSKYFACHSSLQIWNSENLDADGSSSNRWDLFSFF